MKNYAEKIAPNVVGLFWFCPDRIKGELVPINGINGARGWEFHPASMALQAIVCSRPPKLNSKVVQ